MNIAEYKSSINCAMEDTTKILSIILIVHFLFYCIDGEGEILSEKIVKLLLYTIISISVYHFIIKKFIKLI